MKLTQKIILASMFSALICIATMIIKIPLSVGGYINLGDCAVLLSGWILPPFYSFLAAGIGSALADVFSGYMIYVPATFIIKGLMALACFCSYNFFKRINKGIISRIVSGFFAELVMVFGYYLYDGIIYGFKTALLNVPMSAVQAIAGLFIGVILIKIFEKNKLIK